MHRIVTGVTSDIGVLSTCLFFFQYHPGNICVDGTNSLTSKEDIISWRGSPW